ncbi:MAG: hypothetical protein WCS31_03700 [Verrucomicrobiae bacterium]
MTPQQIAFERLAELGCDTLPKVIRESIASAFAATAESNFRKLARRHITSPKVARHFLDFLKQKNEGVNDYLDLPLQGESIGIAGTNPPH